jgi:hypothetical protein
VAGITATVAFTCASSVAHASEPKALSLADLPAGYRSTDLTGCVSGAFATKVNLLERVIPPAEFKRLGLLRWCWGDYKGPSLEPDVLSAAAKLQSVA